MRLVIETHWNKVEKCAGAPFGTRVLEEYEKKSSCSYPNGGGWTSRGEWEKAVKNQHRFQRFDEHGRAVIDQGRKYGIHSYQLVYLED